MSKGSRQRPFDREKWDNNKFWEEKSMNIYLIEQSKNMDYDTYDEAVVYARSEEEARMIHPEDHGKPVTNEDIRWSSWAKYDDIKATLIGTTKADVKAGDVICSSFNAG